MTDDRRRQPDFPTARRRRRFIVVMVLFWAAVVTAVLVAANRWMEHVLARRLRAAWIDPKRHDGEIFPHAAVPAYVWDKDVFLRPRAFFEFQRPVRLLDGSGSGEVLIRQVERGLVRHEAVGPSPGRPVVLLIGDSNMHSVADVGADASSLLEAALRAGALPQATVLNGSCPFYGPYQYLLRARSLWDEFDPNMLIVVIFTGNDLLDLDDIARPHLDDARNEQPPDPAAPIEQIEKRKNLFLRHASAQFEQLFWQGMDQAIYFALHPKRYDKAMDKARQCVLLFQQFCDEQGVPLVAVLLPAYDDFVDYNLPFAGKEALADAVQAKTSRRFRLAMAGAFTARGMHVIDMADRLRGQPPERVFLDEFHVSPFVHAELARVLAPVVADLLSKNPPSP